MSSAHFYDRQQGAHPDLNYPAKCQHCGESYGYEDYWLPRYVDGKDWNPAEITFFCDQCLELFRAEYNLAKKRRQHRQLTEFNGGGIQ